MITKEQKVRLGIFVVVSVLLLAGILAVFIMPKLKDEWDIYFIDFSDMSVNGVNVGAEVKYQGVNIGKVNRIRVNPKDLRSILVYVKIQQGFPVKTDMRASLQYTGITGLRFVEISGGRTQAANLKKGGKILTKRGLGEKAEDIVLNIDSVVEAVNNMLNPANQEKFGELLANLERSSAVMADMLEKRQNGLSNTLDNIDKITGQLQSISTDLGKFTTYLNNVSEKFPAEKLNNVVNNADNLIKNVSERFSEKELGKLLETVENFTDNTTVAMRKIENNFHDMEGEFSKTLLALRESMENLARFTRDLREDPTLLIRRRSSRKRGEK